MNDTPLSQTVLIHDPFFARHDASLVDGVDHVECPERVTHAIEVLTKAPHRYKVVPPSPAAEGDIERVHSSQHLARVRDLAKSGGGALDPDTTAGPDTFAVAMMAAGAGLEAIRLKAATPAVHPFCLVRPPGHHATPTHAMGFCFFNNIAIAAAYLLDELNADRVLIVDFDVHHGNGTQDAFYANPLVHFISSHRTPFYPNTGAAEETGTGPGAGTTTNLPIAFGTDVTTQLGDIEGTVRGVAERFDPDWILVSAGFDTYRDDPVGGLGWHESHFHAIGEMLGDVARTTAGGRLVSFLEGGYNIEALPRLIAAYLRGVAGE